MKALVKPAALATSAAAAVQAEAELPQRASLARMLVSAVSYSKEKDNSQSSDFGIQQSAVKEVLALKAQQSQNGDNKQADTPMSQRGQEKMNEEMIKTAKSFSSDPLVQLSLLRAMQQQRSNPRQQVHKNKLASAENSSIKQRVAIRRAAVTSNQKARPMSKVPLAQVSNYRPSFIQLHLKAPLPQPVPVPVPRLAPNAQPVKAQPVRHELLPRAQQDFRIFPQLQQAYQPSAADAGAFQQQVHALQLLQALSGSQDGSSNQILQLVAGALQQPPAVRQVQQPVHNHAQMDPLGMLILQFTLTNNFQNQQQQGPQAPAADHNSFADTLQRLGLLLTGQPPVAQAASMPNPVPQGTERGHGMSNFPVASYSEEQIDAWTDPRVVVTVPCRARGMPKNHNFKVRAGFLGGSFNLF